jgi:threonine dehydratase
VVTETDAAADLGNNDGFLAEHAATIREAASRLAGHVRRTPTLPADEIATGVAVKPEMLQPTGSFKVRGAFNAALSLLGRSPDARGVITVSSGNHGQAVALAARNLGLDCTVVMPEGSNPVKVAAVRALGARVVSEGVTGANREERARELQERTGLAMIHPFDAWDTIHGQGTIGLELLDVPSAEAASSPAAPSRSRQPDPMSGSSGWSPSWRRTPPPPCGAAATSGSPHPRRPSPTDCAA